MRALVVSLIASTVLTCGALAGEGRDGKPVEGQDVKKTECKDKDKKSKDCEPGYTTYKAKSDAYGMCVRKYCDPAYDHCRKAYGMFNLTCLDEKDNCQSDCSRKDQ
jgi:hypothetical protein